MVRRRRSAPQITSKLLKSAASTLEELITASKQPDADPFDLLCHVAYNMPHSDDAENAQNGFGKNRGIFRALLRKSARAVLDDILKSM